MESRGACPLLCGRSKSFSMKNSNLQISTSKNANLRRIFMELMIKRLSNQYAAPTKTGSIDSQLFRNQEKVLMMNSWLDI